MKIWICRTSEYRADGEKRDFESLDKCIETLEKETVEGEFVVYRPTNAREEAKDCKWQVEIYDTWRE